ncbi:MAG: cystine transporter subunit [Methanomassiliicoccales archaeon PtaU1.Bin124]|nr:MAG: cystine transporter subunit [Methanomassiliicoccales archaeon PtaU1.Bin124]
MSESAGDKPSASPELVKKKGPKPILIAAVAIIVVIALVAVVVAGGFLNTKEKTTLEKIKDRGYIIVGTDVPYPPFEFYNTTSAKYEGVDMEVINKVAQYLNVTVKVVPYGFSELIGAVQTGKIDVAISSMTITASREEAIDFSVPYYDANQACLVKDGSSITSAEDLRNIVVAAQLGTTGAFWVQDNLVTKGNITSGQAVVYDFVDTAVLSVQNGQSSCCIIDTPVANGYATDTAYNLHVAFTIQTNEQYGIAMKSGETSLKAAVDAALTAMKNDGSLHAILEKYNVL